MANTSSKHDFLGYHEEIGGSNRTVQIRISRNDQLQPCRDWLRCQPQNQIANFMLNRTLKKLLVEVEDLKTCDDILDYIACNRNLREFNLYRMVVSADFFEKLLNNDSPLFHLCLGNCHLSSYNPSVMPNIPTISQQILLDRISQSFHLNSSLTFVYLHAGGDVDLTKAMLKGLAGHQSLTEIQICYYMRLDKSFSESLTDVFCTTRGLHKINFSHCKISYELLHPIAISIMDTNCMSKISTFELTNCKIFGDNTATLLHHFCSKAKISTLIINDSTQHKPTPDEYKLRISNRVYLTVLVKTSNLLVINLIDVAIDNYEYVDKKKTTEAFWDTLTMNKKLQFLSTPYMKHNEIEYVAFLRCLPKLNIKGIQLNIYDFPDDINQNVGSFILMNAFRNNFSLVRAEVYNNMYDDDHQIFLVENKIGDKLKHYCKRNAVLELLINKHNDDAEKLDVSSDEGPDEVVLVNESYDVDELYLASDEGCDVLALTNKSYAKVKPLPKKMMMLKIWPFLLHQVTKCDAPFRRQMIFKCLYHGLIGSIGQCTDEKRKSHKQESSDSKKKQRN